MIRTRAILLTLAALVVLAGCSSDPDPEPGVAPTSSAPSAGESSAVESTVIPAEEARDLVDDGAVLIDVRNEDEFTAGHLQGAKLIPLESGDFDAGVEPLDREATYVVYCASGRRAAIAVARMTELGFADVHNAGGLDDVADIVGPVETGS